MTRRKAKKLALAVAGHAVWEAAKLRTLEHVQLSLEDEALVRAALEDLARRLQLKSVPESAPPYPGTPPP